MARVLIADDSHLARKQAKGVLTEAGYEVLEAKNGREAVELLKIEKFDFVLLDLLMPEMEGIDVVEWMKENDVDIPFAILSADIQFSTRDIFMAKGAAGVLNKPPQSFQLLELLEKNIKHS